MCYRRIPPRGRTAPSPSFEEVAHHRIATTSIAREEVPLRVQVCPVASCYSFAVTSTISVPFHLPSRLFLFLSFAMVAERKRERESIRFGLIELPFEWRCVRVCVRLMTGCTLDTDVASPSRRQLAFDKTTCRLIARQCLCEDSVTRSYVMR